MIAHKHNDRLVTFCVFLICLASCGRSSPIEGGPAMEYPAGCQELCFVLESKPKISRAHSITHSFWIGTDLYEYEGKIYTFAADDLGVKGRTPKEAGRKSTLVTKNMEPIKAFEYKGNRYLLLQGYFVWGKEWFEWRCDSGSGEFEKVDVKDLPPQVWEVRFVDPESRKSLWSWCVVELLESAGEETALRCIKRYLEIAPRFLMVPETSGLRAALLHQICDKRAASFFEVLAEVLHNTYPDDPEEDLRMLYYNLCALDIVRGRPALKAFYEQLVAEKRDTTTDHRLLAFHMFDDYYFYALGLYEVGALPDDLRAELFEHDAFAIGLDVPRPDVEPIYETYLHLYNCDPQKGAALLRDHYNNLTKDGRTSATDARLRAFDMHDGHILRLIGLSGHSEEQSNKEQKEQ